MPDDAERPSFGRSARWLPKPKDRDEDDPLARKKRSKSSSRTSRECR